MKKTGALILMLALCLFLTACASPAAKSPAAAENTAVDYGRIKGDLSGLKPEIAGAWLPVLDDYIEHLGTDVTEDSGKEYLHGGFIRDWDGDGTPELCLLLRTSPRDPDTWDGTPRYGWYPPTLCLYTVRGGHAVRAGECDLYFATAGRESAVAVLPAENGLRLIQWDHSDLVEGSSVICFELKDGVLARTEPDAELAAAANGAQTASAFLETSGVDGAQLLLYNASGEARIEGPANARELRAAVAAKAS